MIFFKWDNNKFKNSNKSKKIVILGLLLSIVLILNYLTNFLRWPDPNFLHFDFSLIPIVICLFIFDFWSSFLLLCIRFFIELIFNHDGIAFWYGPLIQFFISLFFIFSIIVFYKFLFLIIKNNILSLFLIFLFSTLLVVLFSSFINWSWSTALYMKLAYGYKGSLNPFDFDLWYKENKFFFGGFSNWHIAAFAAFSPFNIIKFSVISFASISLLKILK